MKDIDRSVTPLDAASVNRSIFETNLVGLEDFPTDGQLAQFRPLIETG